MKRFLTAAALLLALNTAFADPQSTAFTYQGSLSANGQPADGTFNLSFRLFDAATGGNQLGSTVYQTQLPVSNGRFATDLDFPGAFTAGQTWLEITVGSETLSPRQSVQASPVAQYALDTPVLFSMSGSSGGNTFNSAIGGSSTCFTPSGPSTGTFFSSAVGDISTLLIPVGSTCSRVQMTAALTKPPGAYTAWGAYVAQYSQPTALGQGGTLSVVNVCELPGDTVNAGQCSGTVAMSIQPSDQLAICFRADYSTPAPTNAAWTVRCTAP
jgi:hypothetical protein